MTTTPANSGLTTPTSNTTTPTPTSAPVTTPALDFPLRRRLMMVAIGYVPFLNVVMMTIVISLAATGVWPRWTAWLALLWLLFVPPIVVRATLKLSPLPDHDILLMSGPFLIWWFTAQWQVIFNRLPWIEEIIRLVPGLYSAWLRLWGARIGRFVYWTPGLRILDRSMIDIGDRVVFGTGVKLNPHIIMPADGGVSDDDNAAPKPVVLKAATVRIGSDALVGGYSLLTAGSWIAPGQASPGKREFRPFTGWADGKRVLPPQQHDAPAAESDDA